MKTVIEVNDDNSVVITGGVSSVVANGVELAHVPTLDAIKASANGHKPVGPFDVFTGPWQEGDRPPTDMEMILYPDLFKNWKGNSEEVQRQQTAPARNFIEIPDGGTHTISIHPSGQDKIFVKGGKGRKAFLITIPQGLDPAKPGFFKVYGTPGELVCHMGLFSAPHTYSVGPVPGFEMTFVVDNQYARGYSAALMGGNTYYVSVCCENDSDWFLEYALPSRF